MPSVPLPETFETERLVLRRPVAADAGGIFAAWASDAEVTRYLTWRPHPSEATTVALVERYDRAWRTGEGELAWIIAGKVRPEVPLGCIGITLDGHTAEIGFVLARAWHGRGVMTEALRCLLAHALALPDIWRVSAICDTENLASARVLEKAGMVREGCLKRFAMFPNRSDTPRDCLVFAAIS